MLAAHRMGSHGGQQNFLFGYNPNELHGIGLPDFITPGPPPGPPILDAEENQTLDSFFTGFGSGADVGKDGSMQHFSAGIDQGQNWIMPPTFVGSETSLRPRSGSEWQNIPVTGFGFDNVHGLSHIPPPAGFDNSVQGQNFISHNRYDHNALNQLQLAAQAVQPATYPQGWHQQIPNHHSNDMRPTPRHAMRFGSDSDFQPTGYIPPDGAFQSEPVPNLEWLEAQSSATNTRPNTQPNTQPSSPVVSRKRKLEDQHDNPRRNGFTPNANGIPVSTHQPSTFSNPYPQKKYLAKHDSSYTDSKTPTLALTNLKHVSQEIGDEIEDDADYDQEEDEEVGSHQRSPSPAFGAKQRSSKNSKRPLPPKGARPRKKSSSSNNTPVKSKSKPPRSSMGGTPSSRVPLSADQKKANHTNSEQRRRDATARAYAELYDLVPELDEMGKQSTMKKLEIVVAKVAKVKSQVANLRAVLGLDPDGGVGGNNSLSRPSFPLTTSSVSVNPYNTDQTLWRG